MYTVAVNRDFIAQHYLIGGNWGAENERHSHHYRFEVRLKGTELGEHGYLMDIVDVESELESLADYFRDRTLNDLPEFAGINPSIEHFARVLCLMLSSRFKEPNVITISVRIWENDSVWASYRQER